MAKMNAKWKKRVVLGLSLTLTATLSLGTLAACKTTDNSESTGSEAAMETDTQVIKNGNFKFYSEMTKKDKDDFRAVLNSPTSWSFTSGSPTSDTKSGLVDLAYWDYFTKEGRKLTSVDDAVANWNADDVTVYDRLKFYEDFSKEIDALSSSSSAKKLFNKYTYSVDYEDVQSLREDLGETDGSIKLHSDDLADKGVLMIHNSRPGSSDNVLGTAQYYTSSTNISLAAGTAAEFSVWVKTAKLEHWYADNDHKEVEHVGGAYIGVVQTVGSVTLDQMQIKNINTEKTNATGENNGWEKYTVCLRASTYASTSFKIVLGLGQGTSDNRYEAVNGYALFDDITYKTYSAEEYDTLKSGFVGECTVESKEDAKKFNSTLGSVYGIDLDATGVNGVSGLNAYMTTGLTEEKSGPSKVYTSEKIDSSLTNNVGTGKYDSIAAYGTKANISAAYTNNGYLADILDSDLKNYPFGDQEMILLLSSNGAAYTTTLSDSASATKDSMLWVPAEKSVLVSFFVKTNKVPTGKTGATITLVDGENTSVISAFDSTTVETTDIGTEGVDLREDIYDGWVRCFFFVTNNEKEAKCFDLKFSLGPTSIVSSTLSDYSQGWAAFAGFRTKVLSKTELSYASTGDRAVKATLTGTTEDKTRFDTASAVRSIKEGLAIPSSFKGVLAGSNALENNDVENKIPDGVYAGLLNHEYIDTYLDASNSSWNGVLTTLANGATGATAWNNAFGSGATVARQPLVIMNTGAEASAYGFMTKNLTVSANTYQEISMRIKLSAGATASVYLVDTSDLSKGYGEMLRPNAPKVTFWYDDNGNICKSDPTEKGFKAQTGTLYTLQPNGLYRDANDSADTRYYANLFNYEVKDGNYVTDDGTVAFYGNSGKIYAYYDEESKTYSTEVTALPDSVLAFARYDYKTNAIPTQTVITVDGTAAAGKWVDVSFFLHTGSTSKSYRLEVWAGSRDNEKKIPANGYVFFDHYTSSNTSNYDALVSETISNLKDAGYVTDDDGRLVPTGSLPAVSYYYTYTFYDALSYLRYDETVDEDEFNPYGEYKQSDYKEELISLVYDTDSEHTIFLNYAASDVTVTPAAAPSDSTDTEETEKKSVDTSTILLIVSSALLAVVLIVVIIILGVRRVLEKHKRPVRFKPVKDNRYKPESGEEE